VCVCPVFRSFLTLRPPIHPMQEHYIRRERERERERESLYTASPISPSNKSTEQKQRRAASVSANISTNTSAHEMLERRVEAKSIGKRHAPLI
jgi:hypothetical protein